MHACTKQQHVSSLHPSLCFLMPSISSVSTCCNRSPKAPSSTSVHSSVCHLIYVTGSVCPADKAQLGVEGHPAVRAYLMRVCCTLTETNHVADCTSYVLQHGHAIHDVHHAPCSNRCILLHWALYRQSKLDMQIIGTKL